MSRNQVRIIIVGAGIAGLSAAQRLYKEGFQDVTILEGSNRTGGRICTTDFGRYDTSAGLVELGANWIHGTGEDNSVYCLANDNNLLKPYVLLDRDGRRIPKSLTDKAWKIFQQLENNADRFYTGSSSTEETITSFDYLIKSMRSGLQKFPKSVREDAWAIYREGMSNCQAASPGVVGTILKDLPVHWIRLNHKVETIRWQSHPGSKVTVHCSNNSKERTFVADHVILTSSLGYLKKHHKRLFSPNLPQYKMSSIEKMGFGKVNKILLHFKNPFWDKGTGSVKFAWSGHDFEFNPDTWYKSLFAFDEVLNNDSVLLGWIHGRAAEYVETLSDDEVKQTCAWLLRKFLNRPSIPVPDSILRSSWCSNQYSVGSYSYVAVGSTDRDLRNLSQPLYHDGKPLVLFSGEATHPKYYSTTHGARSSGLREAERLCNFYSAKSKL
ncbi:hypothetical protein FSP39_011025 [Pinctada imbricata]|uniref:Amine oxidase n=1 Tax=Pinctada imbricata TaxID=66713 RepID=A0AA88XYD5_PINIB|nr:hypothetical protein FSP39_011025 [Pinctada imbricata]